MVKVGSLQTITRDHPVCWSAGSVVLEHFDCLCLRHLTVLFPLAASTANMYHSSILVLGYLEHASMSSFLSVDCS